MRHSDLPNHAAHRPFPLPTRPWIMAHIWHDLMFMHWPFPPDALRRFVRPPLELDTFDGHAWLGIIPFHMSGIRPRCVPSLPWASTCVEINVRTYCRHKGRPGIVFLSLDASKWPVVVGATRFYHLPYFHARMSARALNGDRRRASAAEGDHWIDYSSRRTQPNAPPAEFRARYRPIGDACPALPGTLDHFLTERYALFTFDRRDRLISADIHHLPWPLQPAEAEIEHNTMAAAHGLRLPDVPPLLHFSRKLEVNVWWPQRET